MENTTDPSAPKFDFTKKPITQQSMTQQDLPNAQVIMILGIGSIVLCCCYGAGLIPGVISLVMANTAIKTFEQNPSAYTENSFKNVKTGRTCGIAAIILSVLYVIYLVVAWTIYGGALLLDELNVF